MAGDEKFGAVRDVENSAMLARDGVLVKEAAERMRERPADIFQHMRPMSEVGLMQRCAFHHQRGVGTGKGPRGRSPCRDSHLFKQMTTKSTMTYPTELRGWGNSFLEHKLLNGRWRANSPPVSGMGLHSGLPESLGALPHEGRSFVDKAGIKLHKTRSEPKLLHGLLSTRDTSYADDGDASM